VSYISIQLIPAGSIAEAVKAARSVGGFSLKIEVEVQSEEEANEAIDAGADIIMLDNFDGPSPRVAATNLRRRWNLGSPAERHRKRVLLECSAGLTEENAASYLCNGTSSFDIANQISTFIAQTPFIVVTLPTPLMNRKCPACRFFSQNNSKANWVSVNVRMHIFTKYLHVD
jgi:hypothetical protein